MGILWLTGKDLSSSTELLIDYYSTQMDSSTPSFFAQCCLFLVIPRPSQSADCDALSRENPRVSHPAIPSCNENFQRKKS